MAEPANGSVNQTIRPRVNSAGYRKSVRSDLLQYLRQSFDANGISTP